MRTTTLDRPNAPGKTGGFLIIILLFIIVDVILSGRPYAAALADGRESISIPWEKVEKILVDRKFISGDELFQLLYILAKQEGHSSFFLNGESLRKLSKRITTLFPLDGCETIELRNAQVVFIFAKEQQVAIPNTLRQASLKITRRLVLAIVEDGPAVDQPADDPFATDLGTKSVHFVVKEGALQLHFSFILRLFGGALRDGEGTELVYQIHDEKKISRMQLIEETQLFANRLRVVELGRNEKDQGMQWIDILHPDFPGVQDIGIAASRIAFLGSDVELLPDSMIRIGKDEPRKNEKAWHWFDENLKSFRNYLRDGQLATHINYRRNFGYYFEERQIVMSMGFSGSEEKIPVK